MVQACAQVSNCLLRHKLHRTMREKQDELPVLSIRLRGRCYVLRRIANVGRRFASQHLGGRRWRWQARSAEVPSLPPFFPQPPACAGDCGNTPGVLLLAATNEAECRETCTHEGQGRWLGNRSRWPGDRSRRRLRGFDKA